MDKEQSKPIKSIRIAPEALHQAKIAATVAHMTLGRWLEDAIREKIERERIQNG